MELDAWYERGLGPLKRLKDENLTLGANGKTRKVMSVSVEIDPHTGNPDGEAAIKFFTPSRWTTVNFESCQSLWLLGISFIPQQLAGALSRTRILDSLRLTWAQSTEATDEMILDHYAFQAALLQVITTHSPRLGTLSLAIGRGGEWLHGLDETIRTLTDDLEKLQDLSLPLPMEIEEEALELVLSRGLRSGKIPPRYPLIRSFTAMLSATTVEVNPSGLFVAYTSMLFDPTSTAPPLKPVKLTPSP